MYYLYQHKNIDKEIFYIGRGTVRETKSKTNKQKYPRAYVKYDKSEKWYENSKLGYTIDILEENENFQYIKNKEIELIKECKTCINIQREPVLNVEYEIKTINTNIKILKFKYVKRQNLILLSNGTIFNMYGDQIKGSLNDNKYLWIGVEFIYKQKIKKKVIFIHRVIAEAFVENLNKYCYNIVNHLDSNRSNNNASNLEWTDQKGNMKHASEKGNLKRKRYSVLQYDLDGNFIQEFINVTEASIALKCSIKAIEQTANVNNKVLTIKNFIFLYRHDLENNNNLLENRVLKCVKKSRIPINIRNEEIINKFKNCDKSKSNNKIIKDLAKESKLCNSTVEHLIKNLKEYKENTFYNRKQIGIMNITD